MARVCVFVRQAVRVRFAFLLLGLTAAALGASAPDEEAPQLLSRTGGKGALAGWASVAELRKAAAKGDPKACAQLGEMYIAGNGGVARDVARALPLLERAARSGIASAAFRLGMLLDNGDGVAADHPRARAYFRAAAAGGVPLAYYNIAADYASGHGVRRDYVEALAWMILAKQHGAPSDTEARLRSFLVESHARNWIDRAEARAPVIARELEAAPPVAQLPPEAPLVATEASPAVAGQPRPANDESAAGARTRGAPAPRNRRGASPERPGPTREVPLVRPPDAPAAERPASLPAPEAAAGPPVSVVSITGESLEWRDLETLQRDAHLERPTALFALGQLLIDGDKLPADPDRALVLLERSAALGNADAAYRLADLYTHGRIVTFDPKRGFEYMLMAAKRGARTAVYNMGALYANGRGTPQDYTEALAWFTVAEKYGADFGAAAKVRSYLERTAPDQVSVAQRRAAELLREIDAARKASRT